jgi:tetratricopeptide (TPR) repeat protein
MTATSSVCRVLSPLEAYGEDFAEARPEAEDSALQCWLLVAMCFWRIAQLPDIERHPAFNRAAEILSMVSGADKRAVTAAPQIPVAGLVDVLADAAAKPDVPGQWTPALARGIQVGAEYLERNGAFRLAYSLLSGFRAAVVQLSLGEVGRVVVQQGRIARELGAMQTAEDHYRVAERLGLRIREPDLRTRAVLGRGVIAVTRGNYPEARRLFRRGLQIAQKFHLAEHEAAAHNALLMAAVSAKDIDSALTHGWFLYRQTSGLPERQAEVLVNLAEVALLAGHPESALAACLTAVALTTVDRVLLAGYGSAAIAACRLGRRDVLDAMAAESLMVIGRSNQQFDKAYTLLELAEAYATLGARGEARNYLTRANGIAKPVGFFEILHRAEILARHLAETPSLHGRDDDVPLRFLVGREDSHEAQQPESDVILSPASRRVIQSLAELRS